jgi:hypothetical protein
MEMAMSYPADAFVRRSPRDASRGSLIHVRETWTFNVDAGTADEPKFKTLFLTGPAIGHIYHALSDVGIATAPGVEVEIRIPDPKACATDRSAPSPGAVVIPIDGKPEIWGHNPSSVYERSGYKLNGELVPGEDHQHSPFLHFPHYEVWLKRDGKLLGDSPLFVVGP